MMAALPQLMDPPPTLPVPSVSLAGIADKPAKTSALSREERKQMLVQLETTLIQRELEVGELEHFVAGLAGLKLEADRGAQPDAELVATVIETIETLFAWAATIADEREDKLCEINGLIDDLCAGDETLVPVAGQIISRFNELSGRVQALAKVDREDLIGILLHQVAKQRELSVAEEYDCCAPSRITDPSTIRFPRTGPTGTATITPTPHGAQTGTSDGDRQGDGGYQCPVAFRIYRFWERPD